MLIRILVLSAVFITLGYAREVRAVALSDLVSSGGFIIQGDKRFDHFSSTLTKTFMGNPLTLNGILLKGTLDPSTTFSGNNGLEIQASFFAAGGSFFGPPTERCFNQRQRRIFPGAQFWTQM